MNIFSLLLGIVYAVQAQHSTKHTTFESISYDGPTLLVPDCYMLEKVAIDAHNSLCVYSINSTNGHLHNITFSILGSLNESDTFEFKYREIPSDDVLTAKVYLVLKEAQTLDYKTKSIFNFDVQIEETTNKVPITVKVYKPPVWPDNPIVFQIQEEQGDINLNVSARIGDGQPEEYLNFDIEDSSYTISAFRADKTTLIIWVPNIDREIQDNITIDVVAMYADWPWGESKTRILLLVDDIDDNIPRIRHRNNDSLEFSISQNMPNVLVTEFTVSDPDEGSNSAFLVRLTTPSSVRSAFELSSYNGTGEETFNITLNPRKLNYSDDIWGTFQLELVSEGLSYRANFDSLTINITLYEYEDDKEESQPGSASVCTVSAAFFSIIIVQHWWNFWNVGFNFY